MSGSILDKFFKFLSKEAREQAEKKDKLRKILAKMRKKQKKLEAELAETDDPELRAELSKKIMILQEQRRKGVTHLETLHKP
ncbi:MAG: hypothetical protein ACXIUM_11455 [Wenzhouxiangella sp.]